MLQPHKHCMSIWSQKSTFSRGPKNKKKWKFSFSPHFAYYWKNFIANGLHVFSHIRSQMEAKHVITFAASSCVLSVFSSAIFSSVVCFAASAACNWVRNCALWSSTFRLSLCSSWNWTSCSLERESCSCFASFSTCHDHRRRRRRRRRRDRRGNH